MTASPGRGLAIQASFATAPATSASAQPATAAALRSLAPSASRAMEAMRARAPRPDLMPAHPASAVRAAQAMSSAAQRATHPAGAAPRPLRGATHPTAQRAIGPVQRPVQAAHALAPRPVAPVAPRPVGRAAGPRAIDPAHQAHPAHPAHPAVQRAADPMRAATARTAAVTPLLPQTLQLQPGGQPLPSGVRQRMENLLGADLSEVRIHQGPQPTAINAVAFTAGPHIYFAPGHYRPTEPAGQRLLARQLAYVVQQRAGLARNPHGRGMVVVRDPALDAQADALAELASRPGAIQAKRAAQRGMFQVKTSLAGPGRQHLDLYERGRPVGAADVVLEGQRATLYNLQVAAEHRGRGGGEELLRAAAVASQRVGKQTLALEAADDGSGKLVRWYESQGFRPAGEGANGKPALEASVRALKKPR